MPSGPRTVTQHAAPARAGRRCRRRSAARPRVHAEIAAGVAVFANRPSRDGPHRRWRASQSTLWRHRTALGQQRACGSGEDRAESPESLGPTHVLLPATAYDPRLSRAALRCDGRRPTRSAGRAVDCISPSRRARGVWDWSRERAQEHLERRPTAAQASQEAKTPRIETRRSRRRRRTRPPRRSWGGSAAVAYGGPGAFPCTPRCGAKVALPRRMRRGHVRLTRRDALVALAALPALGDRAPPRLRTSPACRCRRSRR